MPDQLAPTAAETELAARLEKVAGEVAERAAAEVRRNLGRATSLGTKSTPTDTVTATDLEVEALIRRELLAATPDASIVGEEGTAILGESDVEWVIDPIDGTVNFLYDLPVVAVSIAASVAGTVIAGSVADVLRGEVFSARLDGGARLNGQSISVSAVTEMSQALIATGFSYAAGRREQEAELVQRVLPSARDIRCFGSAALHLAWVGCGRLDGYWQLDTRFWDVAAGRLIAAEAGAAVESESPAGTGHVVASAPAIFGELLGLVLG